MSNTDPIKEALHKLHYGFYSITSRHGEEVNAMVANWVMQTSFTPRLIAVGLAKKSYTHQIVTEGGVFAINIFRQDEHEAILGYTKSREKNPDKMTAGSFSAAPITGCPVIDGAAAYVECKLVQMVNVGGDHDIMVGEVVGGEVFKEGKAADMLTLPGIGWSYAG
jgi:flavin reductase (DIM6/NTAB) family NADH-FMN oxidoreductase RutF